MGVNNQVLGLRDRKKIQTQAAIRREAMRLIDENGYANTTVEQIADAAEVSPSTFFRYFPSKEMVLMANDLDLVTVAALAEADCRRTGRESDDFEVRVFVGALAGGLMACLDGMSGMPERMYRALDFMENGMRMKATDD